MPKLVEGGKTSPPTKLGGDSPISGTYMDATYGRQRYVTNMMELMVKVQYNMRFNTLSKVPSTLRYCILPYLTVK